MYRTFVGIDPSINSTGITVQQYLDDEMIAENLYIICPKLTKEQQRYIDKYPYFTYLVYGVADAVKGDDSMTKELKKSLNLKSLADTIHTVLTGYSIGNDEMNIVIEGISYGSSNTQSLADLSGLNFLIRSRILEHKENVNLFIVPPSEIKKFASGYGSTKKSLIIELFKGKHREFYIPKMDDIADSYFMSQYAKKLTNNLGK